MSEATMSREDEIKAIGEKINEERLLMDRNGWTKGIIPIEWGEKLLTENARLRMENEELHKLVDSVVDRIREEKKR